MNILYLEDDWQDAELIALFTKATMHNLTIVSNLQQAQAAMAGNPDLILVDVMLGNTRDGYKFARNIRQQGIMLPLIAVTALATAKDQEDCQQAGFDHVLTKPYTINQLADVIGQYART